MRTLFKAVTAGEVGQVNTPSLAGMKQHFAAINGAHLGRSLTTGYSGPKSPSV